MLAAVLVVRAVRPPIGRPTVTALTVAACAAGGAAAAVPVPVGWGDGCNDYGGVAPAASLPWLLITQPQASRIPYVDYPNVVFCAPPPEMPRPRANAVTVLVVAVGERRPGAPRPPVRFTARVRIDPTAHRNSVLAVPDRVRIADRHGRIRSLAGHYRAAGRDAAVGAAARAIGAPVGHGITVSLPRVGAGPVPASALGRARIVATVVRRLATASCPVCLASRAPEDAYSSDMTVVGVSSLLERVHRAGGRVDVLGTPSNRAALRRRLRRLVGG